jgi:hypothetical protein
MWSTHASRLFCSSSSTRRGNSLMSALVSFSSELAADASLSAQAASTLSTDASSASASSCGIMARLFS